MTLDARLAQAAEFIRAEAHADIGSDHARLPTALLRSGRVRQLVVVEKHAGPAAVARAALSRAGLAARSEVRLGDGFAPLRPGEVESASLTGMGARTLLGILKRAEWLPPRLVLQPNDSAAPLRAWAGASGHHLRDEALVNGFWAYPVLQLEQREGEDPAYQGLPLEAARRFGPHLLLRRDPLLRRELERQLARLEPLAQHARPELLRDLALVRAAWAWLHREQCVR